MKKLLSLSILAATLASTAAFAGPGQAAAVANAAGGKDAPTALLVSKHAAGPTIEGFQIAQTLVDSTSHNGNHATAIKIDLKNSGGFDKLTVELVKTLESKDYDAVQAALMSSARSTNKNLGWTAIVVETGNGATVATISTIDNRQGVDKVHAYVVHTERNQVTVSEVQAKQAVVEQLTSNKTKAKLVAVSSL
ncbi:MAG: hypothetical protein V4496_08040 [Pseudomonadota bacterium]